MVSLATHAASHTCHHLPVITLTTPVGYRRHAYHRITPYITVVLHCCVIICWHYRHCITNIISLVHIVTLRCRWDILSAFVFDAYCHYIYILLPLLFIIILRLGNIRLLLLSEPRLKDYYTLAIYAPYAAEMPRRAPLVARFGWRWKVATPTLPLLIGHCRQLLLLSLITYFITPLTIYRHCYYAIRHHTYATPRWERCIIMLPPYCCFIRLLAAYLHGYFHTRHHITPYEGWRRRVIIVGLCGQCQPRHRLLRYAHSQPYHCYCHAFQLLWLCACIYFVTAATSYIAALPLIIMPLYHYRFALLLRYFHGY